MSRETKANWKHTMRIIPVTVLSAAALALALAPASIQAATKVVHPGATKAIQDAVNAAAPGDKVLVLPGTYDCSEITDWYPHGIQIPNDKPGLRLIAAGPVKLVGPGIGNGTGIRVEADNVIVEGFEVSGFLKGIVAAAPWIYDPITKVWQPQKIRGVRLSQNVIACREIGIDVNSAEHCVVERNTLTGGRNGMSIGPGKEIQIRHNKVTGTLSAWVPTPQSDKPSAGYYGDGFGIMVGAEGCHLDGNTCNNNGQAGIYIGGGALRSQATNNQANGNGTDVPEHPRVGNGIMVLTAPDCEITGNETIGNVQLGIWVETSCGSTFTGNLAKGNGACDLFAPEWSDPACNNYSMNTAETAVPSLELWDVR